MEALTGLGSLDCLQDTVTDCQLLCPVCQWLCPVCLPMTEIVENNMMNITRTGKRKPTTATLGGARNAMEMLTGLMTVVPPVELLPLMTSVPSVTAAPSVAGSISRWKYDEHYKDMDEEPTTATLGGPGMQ